jgi:hypothetical protein
VFRMRGFARVVLVVAVAAALLWPGGGAAQAPTGDTCTYGAFGPIYTVRVVIPTGAPVQAGFAIGAPGFTIAQIAIVGHPGANSTSGLPEGTSRQVLLSSNFLTPGDTYLVAVEMPASFTGSFTVVPISTPPTSYLPPFTCSPAASTPPPPPPTSTTSTTTPSPPPAPKPAFSVSPTATYQPASRRWLQVVTVTVPGVLVVTPAVPLIRPARVVIKAAGKAQIALIATAAGKAKLAKTGLLTTRAKFTFTPTKGSAITKTLTLRLRAAR